MSGNIDDATQGPQAPKPGQGAKDKLKQKSGKIIDLIKKIRKTGPLFATPLGWIIIGIVGVILLIFAFIGAVSFFTTMPGMMLSKIQNFAEDIGKSFTYIMFGNSKDLVTDADQKELADYIESMGYTLYEYGFGEKVKVEGKDDEYTIDSSYLKAYIVADINTYKEHTDWQATLGSAARNFLGFIYPWGFGNYLTEDENKYQYGMLDFEDGILDGREVEGLNKQELILSVNQGFSENYYRYNIEGWSARYGKPMELLLTLHLVTMAPDLAYNIAMDPQENTLLKIGLHKQKSNIKMYYKFTTGDTSELAAIDGLDISAGKNSLSTEDMEKIVKLLNKTTNNYENIAGAIKQLDFLGKDDNIPLIAKDSWFLGQMPNEILELTRRTDTDGITVGYGVADIDTMIADAFEDNKDSKDEEIKEALENIKENKKFDKDGKYEYYYTDLSSKISEIYTKDEEDHMNDDSMEYDDEMRVTKFSGSIGARVDSAFANANIDNPDATDLLDKVKLDGVFTSDQKDAIKKIKEKVEKLKTDMNADMIQLKIIDAKTSEGKEKVYDLLEKYGITKEALETAIDYNKPNKGTDKGDDKDILVPFIKYTERHWFKDVIFKSDDGEINVYEEQDGGQSRSYTYHPTENADNADSMSGSEYGNFMITETPVGKVYKQTKDAVRGDLNTHTKKLFEESKYFIYDGTKETADKIKEYRKIYTDTFASKIAGSLKGTIYEDAAEEAAKKAGDEAVEEKQKEEGLEIFKKIDIKKESLGAFSILENMKTEDADYILRDLKELLIELKYFTREDLRDKEKAVFTWMVPDYHPKTWPNRKYEKQNIEYGTLIRSKASMDKIIEGEEKAAIEENKNGETGETGNTEDGNNATEETTDTTEKTDTNSLENILFVGDSWSTDTRFQGEFKNCTFKAVSGVAPGGMVGKATGVSNVKKVCILLGLNNPSDISGMKDLIAEMMKEYPSATIYVQRVCHVGKGYKYGSIDADKMNKSIDKFNNEIGTHCASQPTKIKFIDTTTPLQDESGYLAEEYWADKSSNDGKYHLNDAGVKIWVENIKKGLQGFEEDDEIGFEADSTVVSPVTGEVLEVGDNFVKIKILDTDKITEYKDFLKEYEDLCQGYEIRIEGITTQDITTESKSRYIEKKYGDKYFVRNAYTEEERKKIEQAEKDKAEAQPVIEQDGKKYIKEGTVIGKTTDEDIKIILQNREKSIVEDVETYMKVSKKQIFTDFREEYLYWLAVTAEGMDITTETTWTAVNIGDGTVTVGPGVTNYCEKEFKELGYGSSWPMVTGSQYDKYMIADIYIAELEKWKNVFMKDVNDEPQEEQVVEAFTSLLYNAGSGGALYKNRINAFKANGSVEESVWVQAQSGKFHNGLMKRRKSEHILLTETSSDGGHGKLTEVYDENHPELEFSSETPFTDALDGKDTKK